MAAMSSRSRVNISGGRGDGAARAYARNALSIYRFQQIVGRAAKIRSMPPLAARSGLFHAQQDLFGDTAQDVDFLMLESGARVEAPQARHEFFRIGRIEEIDRDERLLQMRVHP